MTPATAPATQQFVEIKEIKNGIIHLRGGGLRKVLIVGGINFDLKSEEEQNLVLASFQSFINTLDFSIQFFIHSRKVNIGSYLEKIGERKQEETNELLKVQIDEYIDFVRLFVEENPIITKSFFAVVPYTPTITVAGAQKGILSALKKTPKGPSDTPEKTIQQLSYRVSQIVSGLGQIGLRVRELEDDELIELFYNLYNPELVEKRGTEIPHTK